MKRRPWTADEDALLGTAPDAKRVDTLGRKRVTISRRRELLGIPPFVRRWTAEEDALLRTLPDAEVSARTGRSRGAVKIRRSKLQGAG